MTEPDAELLRARGLRVTQGRIAVLGVLDRLPHADAESVHRALAEVGGETSVQSVHNVLGDLTAAGLVRRFEPARSAARYERRIGDNHHHAYCVRCGQVEDVDCAVGGAPCLSPSEDLGMQLLSADVLYRGICRSCRAAEAAAAAKAGA